ncbi:MAG: SDR family NAD(P)-dependent oxidoreductase [Desulfobacterales bacterium]
MDYRLDGKTAFVSGSTAGIGFSIAELLAREKATVIVNGRTWERVESAIGKIHDSVPGSGVDGIACDLSTAEGANEIISRFPDFDILVNNMGIFEPRPFELISDEDWLRLFEANVMSGVRLSRYYLPVMKRKNWGRIIFVSSESAVQIPAEMIHYGMTKSAQIAVARGMAETTVGTGVTVNSVLPGPTRSEGVGGFVRKMAEKQGKTFEEMEKEFFREVRPTSLLKRFTETHEVAHLVVYLASPLSSATNGAAMRVEGGVVRSML